MKKEIKTEIVPEKIIPQTSRTEEIYIADDGTVFKGYGAEKKCKKYEKILALKEKIKDIPRKTTYGLDEDWSEKDSFYIKTKEQYDNVLECLKEEKSFDVSYRYATDVFKGEDWYMFWSVDGGDYRDSYYIETLTSVKDEIKDYLEQFE